MEENSREFLSKNINDILKLIIDYEVENEGIKFYTGKVINNNDPLKEGRCQIKVYGIYDNIPNEDLPWAQADFNFIGGSKESFIVPKNDTLVRVYFDQNDIYLPHYTNKVVEVNKLSSLRLEDYPNTMIIFETDDGDYLTLNRKTKKLKFHHNSGNTLEITKDGNVEILVKKNKNETVNGDETHTVKGNHIIQNATTGKIKIDSLGNIDIEGNFIKITPDIALQVGTSTVIPTGVGPFMAVPNDIMTGMPWVGNTTLK